MSDQEIGDINKTGRGVKYSEQPDGTFARILEILLRAFNPVFTHSQNSSLSSAVTLVPETGSNKLLIQAFTNNVRYTLDGTTPTASLGFVLTAGDAPLVIPIGSATIVKVIEETASASIDFQFGV